MTDGSRRIRRRRITSESNLSDETQLIPPDTNQSPRVRRRSTAENPSEESRSFSPPTTEGRRIRRTSTSSENPPEKETSPLPEPNTEASFSEKNNQNSPNLITGIDQIKAELIDDQRFSLVESEYSDETHDWGEGASEDYWHFLGQYE